MRCGVTKGSRHLFLKIILYLFILAAPALLLLRCDAQGLVAVLGLLIMVASLIAEHWLLGHGLQQLWSVGSMVAIPGVESISSTVVVHGLSSFPSMWDLLRPEIEPVSRGLTHLTKLQKQMQDQLHNDRW